VKKATEEAVEVVAEEEAVVAVEEEAESPTVIEKIEPLEKRENLVNLESPENLSFATTVEKLVVSSLETAKRTRSKVLALLLVEAETRVVVMEEAVALEPRDTEMVPITLPEITNMKVTINRTEPVVEDVEIANREVAKLTGARTVRKNHPLRSRVKLKPLSKRPNRLSPLRRKNLRKKDSPTKNT
jgi:hypothetical protein